MLVPEVTLHLADVLYPLWHLTEEELTAEEVPPPFWAFAWAGGQALARYILDHPQIVRSRSVLDFASGSGLAAIAAARSGAASVVASDIDPLAREACRLNALLNGVRLEVSARDWTTSAATASQEFDVILAGDVFYEEPMAGVTEQWLRAATARGLTVLVGDPRRTYFPRHGIEKLTGYAVPVSRELEDSDIRGASVWRFLEAE